MPKMLDVSWGKLRLHLDHGFSNPKSYLYDLVRIGKPLEAIETGVHGGMSTSFILQALHDNGRGHLYSIDLPEQTQPRGGTALLNGKKTGWLVPDRLKYRWGLILGDSKVELPKLVAEIGDIDFFHHDSLHTYEHMMFEFLTIWPRLKQKGILASDDIDEPPHSAFLDFCALKGIKPVLMKSKWGYKGYVLK